MIIRREIWVISSQPYGEIGWRALSRKIERKLCDALSRRWMNERESSGVENVRHGMVLCFVDKNVKLLHVGDTEIFSSSSANSQNDNERESERDTMKTTKKTHVDAFDEINVLSQLSLLDRNIFLFCKKTHLEICLPPIFEIVHLVVHLHFHWIHLTAELRGEGWARMDWIVFSSMYFFSGSSKLSADNWQLPLGTDSDFFFQVLSTSKLVVTRLDTECSFLFSIFSVYTDWKSWFCFFFV